MLNFLKRLLGMNIKGTQTTTYSIQTASYLTDTGTANNYAVSPNPSIASYTAGLRVCFKVANSNTGACTLSVSGLAAKTLKKNVSSDLVAGDLQAGQIVDVDYDGTNFQVMSISSVAAGSGTSGTSGVNGNNGLNGTSGSSGSSGTSGNTGSSGTSGVNGNTGTSGSSGISGSSGSSGLTGSSGTSGINGNNGTSGTSGVNGNAGTSGTSGTNGPTGGAGTSGSSGLSGDKYSTISSTSMSIPTVHPTTRTLNIAVGLSYSTGQNVVIANSLTNLFNAQVQSYNSSTGAMVVSSASNTGSGTFASWTVNLSGAVGIAGTSGSSGTSGNTGTSGSSGVSGTGGTSGLTGTSGTSGTSPVGGAGIITTQNAVYVSKNGSDSTGTRNRLDLPFLSVESAFAAAIAGDTVVVFPGTYTVNTILATDKGVNFQFLGQGTVTLGGAYAGALFGNATGTTANCTISAPDWTFNLTGSNNNFITQNTAGTINVTFGYIEIPNGIYSDAININGGTAILKGKSLRQMGSSAALSMFGASTIIKANIDYIESNDATALTLNNGSAYITAKQIKKLNTVNIDYLVYGLVDPGNEVFVHAEKLYTEKGWAVYIEGFGKAYVRAQKAESGGTCTVVSGLDDMLTVQIDEITNHRASGTYGLLHAENGNMTAIGCNLVRIGTGGGVDVKTSGPGSKLKLIACSYNPAAISEADPGSITRIDNYFQSGLGIGNVANDDTLTKVLVLDANNNVKYRTVASIDADEEVISQTAHGFFVGWAVQKNSSGTWVRCQGTTSNNASYADGYVSAVIDANTFKIKQKGGRINTTGLGLAANTVHYLSNTGSGVNYTATAPTTVGDVYKEVFRTNTANEATIIDGPGYVIQ